MNKILIAVISVIFIATAAFADSTHDTINYGDTITNNNAQGGAGGTGVGYGGNATNNVTNRNDVNNRNDNTNVNYNENRIRNTQKQAQGQAQLQGQGQVQNNNQVIAPSQSVTVDDPRQLPGFVVSPVGPTAIDYRGPFATVDGQTAFKPWTVRKMWTRTMLKSKTFSGSTVDSQFFYAVKAKPQLYLNELEAGMDVFLVGAVTIIGDSSATVAQLFAEAVKIGFDKKAYYYKVVGSGKTDAVKGKGWTAGVGGGGTAVNGGASNYGGGFTLGFGYSSTESGPVSKPWISVYYYVPNPVEITDK